MAKMGQYVALRDEYLQGASLYDAQRRAEKLCWETGYDVCGAVEGGGQV